MSNPIRDAMRRNMQRRPLLVSADLPSMRPEPVPYREPRVGFVVRPTHIAPPTAVRFKRARVKSKAEKTQARHARMSRKRRRGW